MKLHALAAPPAPTGASQQVPFDAHTGTATPAPPGSGGQMDTPIPGVSAMPFKTDRVDARNIALRCGRYWRCTLHDRKHGSSGLLLSSRQMLVCMRIDLGNHKPPTPAESATGKGGSANASGRMAGQ